MANWNVPANNESNWADTSNHVTPLGLGLVFNNMQQIPECDTPVIVGCRVQGVNHSLDFLQAFPDLNPRLMGTTKNRWPITERSNEKLQLWGYNLWCMQSGPLFQGLMRRPTSYRDQDIKNLVTKNGVAKTWSESMMGCLDSLNRGWILCRHDRPQIVGAFIKQDIILVKGIKVLCKNLRRSVNSALLHLEKLVTNIWLWSSGNAAFEG